MNPELFRNIIRDIDAAHYYGLLMTVGTSCYHQPLVPCKPEVKLRGFFIMG